MDAKTFLNALEEDRRKMLSPMRDIILKFDTEVTEEVSEMMGKEMLIYKQRDLFKYALASTKAHLSFHSMVLYGCPPVHLKFSKLLPKAKFQKGCINFKNLEQLPLSTFEELVRDSANVAWPPKIYQDSLEKAANRKKKKAE